MCGFERLRRIRGDQFLDMRDTEITALTTNSVCQTRVRINDSGLDLKCGRFIFNPVTMNNVPNFQAGGSYVMYPLHLGIQQAVVLWIEF